MLHRSERNRNTLSDFPYISYFNFFLSVQPVSPTLRNIVSQESETLLHQIKKQNKKTLRFWFVLPSHMAFFYYSLS